MNTNSRLGSEQATNNLSGNGSSHLGGLRAVADSKPRKRRRKYRRIKPERQRAAIAEYEKTLAQEEVKS